MSAFMERLGSGNTLLEKVLFLRGKLVEEWLRNKSEYQKFLVDTELEDVAAETRPIIATPIYLAFNHAGPGHYDAVVICESTVSTGLPDPEPVHDKPLKVCGCRCGKGAAQKRSVDGGLKLFCVQIPGERRVSCPCFLAQQGCNNCKCCNCGNYYGKQDNSQKLDSDIKIQRKRDKHFVQSNSVNSLQLITERNVEVAKTSWSELETLLFESMINTVRNKSDGDLLSSDVAYLMKTFNSLCDIVNSSSLPLPVNGKTNKQIEGKLRHLLQQTTLFKEFYMNQVAFNLSQ
ncbi:hypothetical protein OS493_007001 [Desmophyllum pertusum]|uniref:Uncharacterized protein n=1 Tax=Desmophyllum pertusum TaxID=174260 RepID=A0A9X0CYX9_9CNID|nr:hypothetical protein OS493_007001 [Desmophyllum pertusum]